jgi:hypothetical protein
LTVPGLKLNQVSNVAIPLVRQAILENEVSVLVKKAFVHAANPKHWRTTGGGNGDLRKI